MKTNKHRTQTGIKFLRSLLIVHSTNLWFVGDWYEERHKKLHFMFTTSHKGDRNYVKEVALF